ncbi:MAG: hypothetical protein ABS76_33615 [Pelagibacterium sp. SCN 64-44]|nr:MAG: hypothetical protein ABS76_33615 [Pelagibacterium sp. SCN 64-44]
MPYLIDATDRPGSQALRQTLRPRHLAFVDDNAHRLLAAGAKLSEDGGPVGTFYILSAENRSEVEAFAAADPYTAGELFADVIITRWRKGYFNFVRAEAPPLEAGK